ncbi:MAG TPA: NYN domain-containing protein [Chloroflexia bacterium]
MPEAASVDNLKAQAAQGINVIGIKPTMVKVYRSEEKGTDVNLAAHLIHDAHLGRYEAALVISNDSDLRESVRIVKDEIGKVVGVFTPHRDRPSVSLQKTASFFREIKTKHLKGSLFPDTLTDAGGTFTKPTNW